MKRILLIGDSIRKGYDKYVKMAFDGVAEVIYTEDNTRFSSYVLRALPDLKRIQCNGENVDLVHWNAGLWDCLTMPDGMNHTPIEIYKEYIERDCNVIEKLFPGAKMIFATSTPVQEHLFGSLKRFNSDIEKYNAAASDIVLAHGGEINDLYDLMSAQPVEYHSDMTHFYTKEGTRVITDQVISHIEKSLDIKAKKLDYDELFSESKNIIGI